MRMLVLLAAAAGDAAVVAGRMIGLALGQIDRRLGVLLR
jgi:hypothetical protein